MVCLAVRLKVKEVTSRAHEEMLNIFSYYFIYHTPFKDTLPVTSSLPLPQGLTTS